MKRNKLKKSQKWLIAVVSVVLVAAIVAGIVFAVTGSGGDPIGVYNFNMIGMTEYWGDTQSSYGPVSTEGIQTVFLTDTQTVTEVTVKEGDEVKKGDLLLRFDTTLSDLQLERKRLEVEKAKLQLEDDQKRLQEIKGMKPMVTPPPTEPAAPDQGVGLTESYQIYAQGEHDGSSKENAILVWLKSDTAITQGLVEAIRQEAERQQNENRPEPEPTDPSVDPSDPSDPSDPVDPSNPSDPVTPTESEPPTEPVTPSESSAPTEEGGGEESPSAVEDPEDPEEPEEIHVSDFYAVFKITSGDMSKGSISVWQGMHIYTANGLAMRLFNANGIMDYSLAQETEVTMPDIDFGSGFTAAQIAQMRREQEKTIKEDEFKLKVAEAEYNIMEREMSDGNVYAEIDGKVVTCLTAEEAKQTQQPMLKISGGGGFLVTGYISELIRDKLLIGQEVTVNDWRSGMTYTGTVQSVGDFPASNRYYGNGNSNATYYPFTVFIDESANLQAWNYVDIQFSVSGSENGIYLSNPFVRTENGESYVLVQGEDGRLEKRVVTVGKSLWGSYTEILSGLSTDDMIAFPYGKGVKPGVKAEEGDLNDLYSY